MREQGFKLIREIKDAADDLCGNDYFGCVYGSHSIEQEGQKSDFDLFIATPNKISDANVQELVQHTIELHKKSRLNLDDEVPHEMKLVYTYEDLQAATAMSGFQVTEEGNFFIPKIRKEIDFLHSNDIRYRLALNALTKPNVSFGPNETDFLKLRNQAEHSIALLALDLVSKTRTEFSESDLLKVLLKGPNGEFGEMHLGYKNYSAVISHLKFLLRKNLLNFETEGLTKQINRNIWTVVNNKLPVKIKKYLHKLKE